MEVIELTLLSPCVSVREYRGSAQRARGLEYKEQIKRISCNRDYLLQEKKIISIQPSPPAVSRSLTGCFVMQNIGEVARSDGGVNKKQQPERFVLLAAEKNEPRIKLHHRYRT